MLEDVIAMGGGRRSSEVLAYAFDGLAGVALYKGDNARAATLLGIGNVVRVRSAHQIWPDMRPLIDGLVAGVKAAVGEDEFDIAWKAGHSLTRSAAKASPSTPACRPPRQPDAGAVRPSADRRVLATAGAADVGRRAEQGQT